MEGTSFHGDRIGRKVRGREMGFIMEEQHQQVPENDVTSSQSYNYHGACEGGDGAGRMANELGGMLFGDEEMLKWNTLEMKEEEISFSPAFWDNSVEKGETVTSAAASSNGLNLNLNYQEVLDEWSNRGPLWARDYYYSSRFPQCRYVKYVIDEILVV
uniref:Uncharacterized protein n=1 Tax=Kalanchoe fedtschenkoi TaxID=63787 RepID=A0A7N1A9F6_KALFE